MNLKKSLNNSSNREVRVTFIAKKIVKAIYLSCFLMASALLTVQAQTVLFSEDFNSCSLSDGWTVHLNGNPDADWYVGMPQNNDSNGSTIDGSCMLIIDDDATGENTPPWNLELISPAFDITGWTTATVSMDVHFRNYDGRDSLTIYAYDGQNYHLLGKYRGGASQTGTQFSQFVPLIADLSFFPSSTMQLVIRYDDGGTWAWWAGIDNIVVRGEGTARNFVLEQFNDCALPEGWQTESVSGPYTWSFGFLTNASATASNSMNGTCFAYIDDDGIGNGTPAFTGRLYGPEMDGSVASSLILDFDVIYRTYTDNESFSVGVIDTETGQSRIAAVFTNDLGGPQLNGYVHRSVDLSAFRSKNMRFFFQYDDGGAWNWWVGVDNVKLSGEGEINEVCEKARPISLDAPCVEAHNGQAIFDGPQPDCSLRNTHSLWYSYTAETAGQIKISTQSKFNDVITVFEGPCEALLPRHCINKDEHGFTGENLYIPVEAGQTYRFRVSGQTGGFGASAGSFCIGVASSNGAPAAPPHARCEQAGVLAIDADCEQTLNVHAPTAAPLPSRNTLARADAWFRFTAEETTPLLIAAGADFADVITLYANGCSNLYEVAVNEYGGQLTLDEPEPGRTYWVRISGAFATIEGGVCPSVKKTVIAAPANDRCISALPVALGGACVTANNRGADFDGPAISCEPFLSGSIWFSFVAPASGSVRLLPDADFMNALSVYRGNCDQMTEVFCVRNPNLCEGGPVVSSLTPGQTYFVRVSSTANISGYAERGNICLSIEDASLPASYTPMSLTVGVECFGNGYASLNINVSGGISSYFLQGNQEHELLAAGDEYIVIATDVKGCERSVSGRIACQADPNCQLTAQVEVTNTACPGGSDGSAVAINIEGGSGSYTYEWSTGATTGAAVDLSAGWYSLTLNDQNGCSIALPVRVLSPAPATLISSEIEPASGNQANGRIAVQVAGGTAPFTYDWYRNNAFFANTSAPELSNAPAGTYTLVVTDANGCQYSVGGPMLVPNITSSTEQEAAAYTLLAFSNPTAGPLALTWDLPTSRSLGMFLVSAEGRSWRLANKLPARSGNHRLDLSEWPAGTYLLRMSDGLQSWTVKVVRVEL